MTSDARAYYAIVSRLRKAGFPFFSLLPGDGEHECDLVITTESESPMPNRMVMTLEELDEDADVVRGQIISRLAKGQGTLVIGIDPGSRMGMAALYGETMFALRTFISRERLCAEVTTLTERINSRKSLVRIGNGNPSLAQWIATKLLVEQKASIEIVDESGTSIRDTRMKGIQGDQRAAARIALRTGSPFHPPS
jgi:hypothetical protein